MKFVPPEISNEAKPSVSAFRKLLLKALKLATRLSGRIHRKLNALHFDYAQLPGRRATYRWDTRQESAFEKVQQKYLSGLTSRLALMENPPLISVLIPIYKVSPSYLAETLASVAAQIYPHWEVCAVDDHSQNDEIQKVLERFASLHPKKVKLGFRKQNGHISRCSNDCLAMASGRYIALLDHDDLLTPNALGEMVRAIYAENYPDILYSDERTVHPDGRFKRQTFFKPAWSPFLHLSCNYTTHLSLYAKELLNKVGGFRVGFEGAQDHDLMLRASEETQKPIIHVPFCLYHWRSIASSTSKNITAKPYALEAGVKAVTEACERRSRPARVECDPVSVSYRIHYEIQGKPLVSIVIPSRNNHKTLRRCVDSIRKKTRYQNYEIVLIDNGSSDPQTLQFIESQRSEANCMVLSDPRPFNFAAMNNLAAQHAHGNYLLFLNDDTAVISPDWLTEMLSHAQLPEVGAVGAKLYYPDRSIQHAGLLLSDRSIAMSRSASRHFGFDRWVHEVACVTAACLMIQKSKFQKVLGFNETEVPNGYGDVDFCLRLRREGFCNLYTPFAELFHYESATRGRENENYERIYMQKRWGRELLNDPYLNPNLTPQGRLSQNFHQGRSLEFDPKLMRAHLAPHLGSLQR